MLLPDPADEGSGQLDARAARHSPASPHRVMPLAVDLRRRTESFGNR
jgi:hypothetical protein